jgi:hypothetical protein
MPDKNTAQAKPEEIKGKGVRLIWQAPEFIYYPKSASWYIGIIFVAAVLIAIFVWKQQYFSAGLVLLIVLVMFVLGRNKPKTIQYILTSSGIMFREKNYPLTDFKSFWIAEGDIISTLYLEKAGKFTSPMTIYIAQIEPRVIRDFLKLYLVEKPTDKDSINEGFSRFLRL